MKNIRSLFATFLVVTMLFISTTVPCAASSDMIITEDTTMFSFTLTNQNLIVDEGVTLTMMGAIYINGDSVITGGGTIKRGSPNGYLVNVSPSANLRLRNITLDGDNVESIYSGIEVSADATASMRDGTTILNFNKITNQGGAIEILSGGSFTMNGGQILGNCARSYGGAVYIAQDATFIFNNGTFDGNYITKEDTEYGGGAIYNMGLFEMHGGTIKNSISTYQGGAIYNSSYGSAYINGGTIESSNHSAHKDGYVSAGDAIFHSAHEGDASELYISGNAQINSDIYLHTDKTLLITGELRYDIIIVPETYEEGHPLVVGAQGYTLTAADAAKILITTNDGQSWYAQLDPETNTIGLTRTAPDNKISTVYIDGVNGSDKNDGKTEETAVKTFQTAKDLIEKDGTIIIIDTITIDDEREWELPPANYGTATVQCNSNGKHVIEVTASGVFNLGAIFIYDADSADDPDGENGATVYVHAGGHFAQSRIYTTLNGSVVYEPVIPTVDMTMDTDSGTFVDGTGMIRFITTLNGANVHVNKVGTYIIPLALFESDFEQKSDVYLERNIDVGDAYFVDLIDIPQDAFDEEIYAISYAVVDGQVITSGSATDTVNTDKLVGESYQSLMEGAN